MLFIYFTLFIYGLLNKINLLKYVFRLNNYPTYTLR